MVADVEFPSGILPWTRFENLGVEVRIVRHKNWFIELEDIAALIGRQNKSREHQSRQYVYRPAPRS